jgi:CheY-like chemotaxis protein
MEYKILYVEDLVAHSIEDNLKRQGYNVITNDAESLEELLNALNQDFDAYVLDFRLTANRGRLDAPAIAQAIRTKGNNHKDTPIVLISNEDKLKEFDKDLTSQDLFDFAISKTIFRKEADKYSKRINSFIEAYKTIKNANGQLDTILGITPEEVDSFIDYRLLEKINSEKIKDDIYANCRFVNISLIRGIGVLIGNDVLSARLGVDKESKDWEKLLDILEPYKYKGVLSEAYDRWWSEKILIWWSNFSDNISLRRTTAEKRVKILKEKLGLDLIPLSPLQHANSTCFWTICMETKKGLDPNEGFIINKKEYFPWQEMEYLSLCGALEQSDYRKFLSPTDRAEIRNLEIHGAL